MNVEELLHKPVYAMTGEEIILLFIEIRKMMGNEGTAMVSAEVTPELPRKHYERGMEGIAKVFGCSVATANRIKANGYINDAITQVGRKITVDADYAMQLAREAEAKGIDITTGKVNRKKMKSPMVTTNYVPLSKVTTGQLALSDLTMGKGVGYE